MSDKVRDLWIFAGVLAGMVVLAVLAVFLPQQRRLENLRTVHAALEQTLQMDSLKVAVIPDLVRQITEMKNRYRDFDQRLPKNQELAGFLSAITNNVAEENLSDLQLEPGSPVKEELYHTLPFKMQYRGSYLAMTKFLDRVSKMKRLTRVHTLRMDKVPQDTRLKIELLLNVYFTES